MAFWQKDLCNWDTDDSPWVITGRQPDGFGRSGSDDIKTRHKKTRGLTASF